VTQAVWEDGALIVGEGGRRQTIVGEENHGPFGEMNFIIPNRQWCAEPVRRGTAGRRSGRR
jgi:hypothetical protein